MKEEERTLVSCVDYLDDGIDKGGFTADDVVAILLPLMKQVQECHEKGLVSPLDGIGELHVNYNHLWYEAHLEDDSSNELAKVVKLMRKEESDSLQVVAHSEQNIGLGEGTFEQRSLVYSESDEDLKAPVYLRGFRSWEHSLGHHDQLTDIFSLGMLLASFALNCNLSREEELKRFIETRGNIFLLHADLHPVLAGLIVQMTELDRHKRLQDLPKAIHSLENYREQGAEREIDYSQHAGFGQADPQGKRQIIQQFLQRRLFEISRRNRLIHFRETQSQLNLTQASVPMLLDTRNIRSEQLFLWHDKLQKDLLSDSGLNLNRYLRFEEAAYLPSTLDKIRSEANKDVKEYGFAQLRLVLVFLHWNNLKEDKNQRIHSPLLLLPVQLSKKKGVKDNYYLQTESAVAEINPALKHHLQELYDLQLPDTVDLNEASLEQFYELLQTQIRNSEKAVTLDFVDKPQIEIIHAKAKQRLNTYRKRARLSGKGVKFFDNIDYSYDSKNYQPLGLQLFSRRVCNAPAAFADVLDDTPRPRKPFVSGTMPETVMEKETQMYRLKEDESNPYRWSFDLCSVTLANFNYRKMSLVQDYRSLIAEDIPNPAFDDLFSIEVKERGSGVQSPISFSDNYSIVPADQSQLNAVAWAREGRSYIIQGPPGTGKSQTISNLIADYAARGKRVLFVCEKRAAIDVVHHRLQQAGLQRLCCLIHDSQSDKKSFVMDLKETYEYFLEQSPQEDLEQRRQQLVAALEKDYASLQEFYRVGSDLKPDQSPVYELLDILIELRDAIPQLSDAQQEMLPPSSQVREDQTAVATLAKDLREQERSPIWHDFEYRFLRPDFAFDAEGLGKLQQASSEAEQLLLPLLQLMQQSGLDSSAWDSWDLLLELCKFAVELAPLAQAELMPLLDGRSSLSRQFTAACKKLQKLQDQAEQAREKAAHWNSPLASEDAELALQRVAAMETSLMRFLNPGFWKLRKILQGSYDFSAHAVQPAYSSVLQWLLASIKAEKNLLEQQDTVSESFAGLDVVDLQKLLPQWRETLRGKFEAFKGFLVEDGAANFVSGLASFAGHLPQLQALLQQLYTELPSTSLCALLENLQQQAKCDRDALHLLAQFSRLSPPVQRSLNLLSLNETSLLAASALREYEQLLREEPHYARFNTLKLSKLQQSINKNQSTWRKLNGSYIEHGFHKRFRDNIKVCSLPAADLTPKKKAFKKLYRAGRRELEHEFSKSMRYKAIRSLSEGDTARVIADLKPIWLMSPLSVSDTLPLNVEEFDVVIFDEASQVQLEEAIPAVYRAPQVIVVGDDKQLPPTNFFGSSRTSDEQGVIIEEGDEQFEYDLNADSFLTQSDRNLPSTMLSWHYRSRFESLISFSNQAFYRGRLRTIPDRRLKDGYSGEISLKSLDDCPAELSLQRSISFHYITDGLYQKRRNRSEAEYIARHVSELLREENGLSIGIVAFSEAQQDEIEIALDNLAKEDSDFRRLLEAEREREQDDQFVGLFVKNLENVQGDERDIIILSICYGHDDNGKMRMNFGPINKSGGEKRLNVVFSRAKSHMLVVSSITGSVITNTYNDGANCLRNYLEYAEAVSRADYSLAQTVLGRLSLHSQNQQNTDRGSLLVQSLAEALTQRGWHCRLSVGESEFRCDLAIGRPGAERFLLAVQVDSASFYRSDDLYGELLLRPAVLQAFGWQCAYVLSKDFYAEPEAVIEDLHKRLVEIENVESS